MNLALCPHSRRQQVSTGLELASLERRQLTACSTAMEAEQPCSRAVHYMAVCRTLMEAPCTLQCAFTGVPCYHEVDASFLD